ncbi:hypothetical protein JDN40_16165 [Rhodomicrobium vannielii ATCC 17100]|uniref:hypothetical protein n=1 Tax=Rhodomicrobium vannielii TaxID=1069 RepID=UPI0019182859|nr:hypothetical protein [Rhodomicrobium vannielii]MBJ7535644.1 hypothetical protein [Rhodomicrobium vannielii ATCC 17100]
MAKPESGKAPPKKKAEPKPKLTDAERHKRFVDVAHDVEASDNPEEFEEVFKKVVKPSRSS